MCIAVYKNFGVGMPKKKVLKRCFRTNPDGAGYGILDKESELWNVKKGFMTWDDFADSFYKENLTQDDCFIAHFRIGTSGKKVHPDCTHPFPITDNKKDLMIHSYQSPVVTMHNGVWGSGDGDYSDTQVAIYNVMSVLYPLLLESENEEKTKKILNMLGILLKENSNRWFLSYKSDVLLIGDWIEDKDTKIWFSNSKHKEVTKTYHNYNNGWKPFNETDKTYLFDLKVARFLQNNIWSWKIWDNYENKEDEKVVELYNKTGKELIAIADSYGNIVMEDSKSEKIKEDSFRPKFRSKLLENTILMYGADHEFPCIQCGNAITLDQVEDHNGECPFCEEILFPNDDDAYWGIDSKKCPSCWFWGEYDKENTLFYCHKCEVYYY